MISCCNCELSTNNNWIDQSHHIYEMINLIIWGTFTFTGFTNLKIVHFYTNSKTSFVIFSVWFGTRSGSAGYNFVRIYILQWEPVFLVFSFILWWQLLAGVTCILQTIVKFGTLMLFRKLLVLLLFGGGVDIFGN